jgi:uncharacterized protein
VKPVFADTSALYALLVATDASHEAAAGAFDRLRRRAAPLITTSYVLVELYALLARRVGLEAVARFRSDVAPLLAVHWVDAPLHDRALDLLLQRNDRALSLVDAASFIVMRDRDLEEAFAFDDHFVAEGFSEP